MEERSYHCPECGLAFQSQQLLEWHRQGVHGPSGPPASPKEATELSRSSRRRIGCSLFGALFAIFAVGGLAFHWPSELVAIMLIGTPVMFVITYFLDEREADWKEEARGEFRRDYPAPAPRQAPDPAARVMFALTPGQEARFPEFVDQWRRVGLATQPADRPKAELAIAATYETAGLRPPLIVWCSSPMANGLTRAIVQRTSRSGHAAARTADEVLVQAREGASAGVSQEVWGNVRQSVAASSVEAIGVNVAARIRGPRSPVYFDWDTNDDVDNDLWDSGGYSFAESSWDIAEAAIRSAAGNDTWTAVQNGVENGVTVSVDHVMYSVGVSIGNGLVISKAESKRDRARAKRDDYRYTGEIIVTDVSSPDQTRYQREKVKARVQNSLGESEDDSIGNSVRASIRNSCYGSHDAGRLALFAYFRSACGLERQTDRLKGQWAQAQAAGWYLPHQHICWVSERHNVLRQNGEGRLHCETGPALEYPDGWAIFALNGVVMESRHVLTPAERLDPQGILGERNVDVRRELLRKVGMPRLLKFGKEVDRQGDYRLIDMSPVFKGTGVRYAPYLLMESVSAAGAQHLEGVSPECRTVEQAINWRASDIAQTWKPEQLS
jgi:hypothetical protein